MRYLRLDLADNTNAALMDPREAASRLFGRRSCGPDAADATRRRRALHAAVRDEISDEQWKRNWVGLIDGFSDGDIHELTTVLEQTSNRDRIQSTLVRLQVERIRQRVDSAKKTVAIYFPTAAYREQLGHIPNLLRQHNCNVITIVGTICGDACEEQADTFYGGHCGQTEIVNHLDFVDLFLTPVLASGLPTAARKAYFLHDIHDSPLGDDATTRKISELLREFDFLFLPSQASVSLFQQVVPLTRKGSDKPIALIPGGYPKLDRLIDYFQDHEQETPTLIYAPTVIGYGFDEVVSLASHGDAIIDAVLRRIPDYKLIFRPHPHTLHMPLVRELAAKYKDHPRFIFDDNASFYMDNYSRASLMISDVSGTAFTYAFATLRPVVFFSPNEEAVQKKYGGLRYVKDRERIGCIVSDVTNLVDKINLILRHRDDYQKAARQCREANIFNVGEAERYFVDHLEHLLTGQRNEQWTYL